MQLAYTPIAYEYREAIEQLMTEGKTGKVFYFNEAGKVDDASGKITHFIEVASAGWFIAIDHQTNIRIDRIITIFGKPGAACDEFYALGDVCLECSGGYDLN